MARNISGPRTPDTHVIESEMQALAGRAPDRPLEKLEVHVWARLARRERAADARRRLLLVQVAVLLFAPAGSLVVGLTPVPRV